MCGLEDGPLVDAHPALSPKLTGHRGAREAPEVLGRDRTFLAISEFSKFMGQLVLFWKDR